MGIGAIRFMWYEGVEHMPPDVRFLYRVATCGFWPDSAFQPNFSRPKCDFQSFKSRCSSPGMKCMHSLQVIP